FKEDLYTITLKGRDGSEKIKEMMTKLRNNPPKKLGDWDVVSFRDYDKDEVLDIKTGAKKPTGLPKSNVLYFDLTDNAWCCARPSGTEPKIKFYMGVKGSNLDDAKDKLTKLTEALKAVL
ncbi:MAG: phospho-sugar mutase, partial [Lachnospiraceae bacterium]|nr:phospho-sugar mutase [Lachnospiraceae bacterium]